MSAKTFCSKDIKSLVCDEFQRQFLTYTNSKKQLGGGGDNFILTEFWRLLRMQHC